MKFLLADDDADDTDLFCEALAGINPSIICYTVKNGRHVLELLSKSKEADLPDIIFVDINMPVMNGWECLKKLKGDSNYKHIPVVIYTTSSLKKDVQMAYDLGALLFLTKPETFTELREILEIIATNSQDFLSEKLKNFHSVKVK